MDACVCTVRRLVRARLRHERQVTAVEVFRQAVFYMAVQATFATEKRLECDQHAIV